MHHVVALPEADTRFEDDLRAFIDRYFSLWQATPSTTPSPGLAFTPAAQRRGESGLDQLIESMERKIRDYPETEEEKAAWQEWIFGELRRVGTDCCAMPAAHLDIILSPGYVAATREFVRRARAFDAAIDVESLSQALRNVWVMNSLQLMLGGQPSITPSVFAYSMLYPYTDNYLDQPHVSRPVKEEACRRLGRRLEGKAVEARDACEAAVYSLIAIVEAEFPRPEHPGVYAGLLAIHDGQVKSLSQQDGESVLDEASLLRISVAKGGASVLADGWLVAGRLSRQHADFFFGLGVMLQLLDDLQDLPEDLRGKRRTLFTRASDGGCLDSPTSRLWNFIDAILDPGKGPGNARCAEIKDLIRRNGRNLLVRSIAESASCYSPGYLRHMEKLSPLSFRYLRESRRVIESKYAKVWPALARRRNLHSIFDLLN